MRPQFTEAAQRKFVDLRDEGICRMERALPGSDVWFECGTPSNIRAHIYRRHHAGKAKYHPDVVITACTFCHDNLDDRSVPRTYPTRVPAEREARAYATITAAGAAPPRKDLEGHSLWRKDGAA